LCRVDAARPCGCRPTAPLRFVRPPREPAGNSKPIRRPRLRNRPERSGTGDQRPRSPTIETVKNRHLQPSDSLLGLLLLSGRVPILGRHGHLSNASQTVTGVPGGRAATLRQRPHRRLDRPWQAPYTVGAGVLNIGKMGPGSEDYYLSLTVDGAEEYYLKRGEAAGRWIGRGLDAVGLDGEVDGDALKAVLAGDHPATGERLASHPARKVPGFDLTFRAPKSVSLAWAFADLDTAAQVLAAHEAAVEAAVGYVEKHAVRTRRGAGGTERVEVDGLVAAAFPHRTSRAGDPLLHTHVLVANLARTPDDGKWRTLESRRIYLHAKTAGFLYQAQLRHELTARLGIAWGPVTNGYADIAGIDRELIDGFSQRRQQIVERMAERGESSAKAAQVATLETRTAKGVQSTEPELRDRWAEQARELGYDPRQLADLLGRHQAQEPDLDGLVRELVDREALTEHVSTFARRDLLQAVAERLPDGAPVDEVEALADAVVEAGREELVQLGVRRGELSSVDAIRTADGRIIAGDEVEPRMTTRRLLLAEQHAINTAVTRQRQGVAAVDPNTVEAVLAGRPSMTGEQAAMLRRLTGDGDGVTVVVGRAGTGKTFTLDAAREAWARAGIEVQGVALAARAARELQEASGIPSMTIHRLLHQIDTGPGSPLRPGSVLVVDEAGMVGTRQLARLLHHAEQQRVKVVLVGDPRQLPEIDAGGLFGHLTRRLDAIQLTDNRRQKLTWEIDALERLRHGDPADALHLYDTHRAGRNRRHRRSPPRTARVRLVARPPPRRRRRSRHDRAPPDRRRRPQPPRPAPHARHRATDRTAA